MKLPTYPCCAPTPAAPAGPQAADAAAASSAVPAAARVCGVLLLVLAVAGGLAHVGGRAAVAGLDGAGASAAVARDPDLIEGIRRQVQQLKDRGMVVSIHDGDPTVAIVTDEYVDFACDPEDLPLYGGYFVGFADEYAWLVNGTHNVRLVLEDGTEIGRRTGRLSDAQFREIYRENRRRLESATAGLDPAR
jgi:hypothetical protein